MVVYCLDRAHCISLLGARANEASQRQLFLAYLKEKCCRTETEFKLEKAIIGKHTEAENVTPSLLQVTLKRRREATSSSAATSSADLSGQTGQIFACLEGDDISNGLQQVDQLAQYEHWLMNEDEVMVDFDDLLGSGGCGDVFSGSFRGLHVAVKITNSRDANKLVFLANELRVLRQVKHDNIVAFYGAFVEAKYSRLVLVLECINGRRLDRYLCGSDVASCARCKDMKPDDERRFTIIHGICLALRYLHAHQPFILHGDLKPANIIVETVGRCPHEVAPRAKLLDFGLAAGLSHRRTLPRGTKGWISPELQQGGDRTPASDTYSFGRVAYVVATMTRMSDPRPLPSVWPNTDLTLVCQATVENCMRENPRERPAIASVYAQLFARSQTISSTVDGESSHQARNLRNL